MNSWVGCHPPGDMLDSGIKPASRMSSALVGNFFFFFFFTTNTIWEAPWDVFLLCYYIYFILIISQSVQFSHSVISVSLWPHELQHTRLPCPSPNPGAYSNSCPTTWWCHPTISSSVVCFSSCLQSFLVSGSFQMSQFFESGGQIIGVSASASVLPMNIQCWSPLGWTGWISLQSKGLSRVFSNTTVQKHQFFGT